MTPVELALALVTGVFYFIFGIGSVAIWVLGKVYGVLLYLMRMGLKQEVAKAKVEEIAVVAPPAPAGDEVDPVAVVAGQVSSSFLGFVVDGGDIIHTYIKQTPLLNRPRGQFSENALL